METIIKGLEEMKEKYKKLKSMYPNDDDHESYYKKVSISIDDLIDNIKKKKKKVEKCPKNSIV